MPGCMGKIFVSPGLFHHLAGMAEGPRPRPARSQNMMKVKLDFCDFGPGYPKTNNFFYNLLKEKFEVEICDCPDFLIFADLGQHVHRVHNCVKIFVCMESFEPDFKFYDYAFTCRQIDDPRNLRLPPYVRYATPQML